MSNSDITRISGNIVSKDKLEGYKEIEKKKNVIKSGDQDKTNQVQAGNPPADLKISEEGLKRLEASKNTGVENKSDPKELLKQIKENPTNLFKAHTSLSSVKVADLLKE